MKQVTRLIKETIANITRPYMRILPGQLAFFFLMSLIPIIALVGTIASTFSISVETLALTLEETFPGDISNTILTLISGEGLNFNMIVFLASAFLLASNGAQSMIITSNIVYNFKGGNMIKRRIKAILMTFVVVGLIFFLLIVPVFGSFILNMLREYSPDARLVDYLYNLYSVFKYPLSLLIIYVNIKLLYTISPDENIPGKTTTKGAIFTTLTWLIATEIYSVYVARFSTYDIFYGSISNIIVLLLWIYILSYIFVLGMAFNAGVLDITNENEKKQKKLGVVT